MVLTARVAWRLAQLRIRCASRISSIRMGLLGRRAKRPRESSTKVSSNDKYSCVHISQHVSQQSRSQVDRKHTGSFPEGCCPAGTRFFSVRSASEGAWVVVNFAFHAARADMPSVAACEANISWVSAFDNPKAAAMSDRLWLETPSGHSRTVKAAISGEL